MIILAGKPLLAMMNHINISHPTYYQKDYPIPGKSIRIQATPTFVDLEMRVLCHTKEEVNEFLIGGASWELRRILKKLG